MAVDTRLKRQSATSLLVPFMTPGAHPETVGVVVAERVAVTWCYSGIDVVITCPEDCKDCCYEIDVTIYYLSGYCPAKFSCYTYNGTWRLTQQGDTGTDCEWLYTDPEYGFTITITCDSGYWWLTIEHDGDTAARWKRSLVNDPTCPNVDVDNWNYVDGDCTGNPWAYAECHSYVRPVYPPAWYHDDLLGVLRYWRQF